MRILIDETFATGMYSVPVVSAWVAPGGDLAVEFVPGLTASDVEAGDAALVPISEIPALQESHRIDPAIAVIANGGGAIAMRTPVRPDEIEATPIRLLDASGTAEMLARATLRPFYGIEPAGWVRDGNDPEAARAEVVIVEGAEALREPEGGFSEDLCRAWFILTAQPVVTHALMIPRGLAPDRNDEVRAFLSACRSESQSRRGDWRPAYAERHGLAAAQASDFWAAQRLTIEADDRKALLALLQQGSPGTSGSWLRNVEYIDGG